MHFPICTQVSSSLALLEATNNFADFVKAFSQFGSDMVDFAHLTGDRQNVCRSWGLKTLKKRNTK